MEISNVTFSASGDQPPRTEQQTGADLHQAIWEASQFKSPAALRDFCEDTIRSIESDRS